MPRFRLGDHLVQQGLLAPTELAFALAHHRRTGERLGRILLTLGFVGRQDLYGALAELWQIPFIRLEPGVLQGEVTRRLPVEDALRFRAIPFRRDGNVVHVAVADPPAEDLAAILRQYYGHCEFAWHATTDWDVDQGLAAAFGAELADRGVSQLYYREPEESVFRMLAGSQRGVLVVLAGALTVLLVRRPETTLLVLNLLAALLLLAVALYRILAALIGRRHLPVDPGPEVMRWRPDIRWPSYTILLPVFRDDRGVADAVAHLSALDYPHARLGILVLVDEADLSRRATLAAEYPGLVRVLAVPPRPPRTKPRTCNVGLFYARGEYLVIYDAEDRPDPDQLKRAVLAHRAAGGGLLAVIALLAYRNRERNLLTRLAAREDAAWFEGVLPGMIQLGLPVPLPASSCHYRTDRLRDLGGWDSWNTASDTDLGVRAAMRGLRVARFASRTTESLAEEIRPWLLQRARWLRGYLQTGLVHARNPMDLGQATGLRQAAAFLLFVLGTPTAFVLLPVCLLLTTLGIALPLFGGAPPSWIALAAAGALVLAGGLSTAVLLLRIPGGARAGTAALLFPLYWMLHTLPALLAFHRVFIRPFRSEADEPAAPPETE